MKKILITAILFLIFSTSSALAYDPLSVPNNKFGIHIQSENDLDDAANLVNSSGGDWGYITFVISENELDTGRWQNVLDRARRLHLIPIIRVATKAQGNIWTKPEIGNIDKWVKFFNSLNWVVQNRYIIIGNEPNHKVEWGGEINPQEYTEYLTSFSKALKASSSDYFILPAGLDLAADNSKTTMEASLYLKKMYQSDNTFLEYIDGWTSHSYPNPNFSGSEKDLGKKSIKGFEWELNYLKSFGLKRDLPVFITETGWINSDEELVSKRFSYAYEHVWSDKRVVAVTPFILNYPQAPFDKFSWKKADGSYKKQYETVANISKTKGEPIQIVKARILGIFISPIHLVNSAFSGAFLAQNLGQSIWATPDIEVVDESKSFELTTQQFSDIEPFKYKIIVFNTTTNNKSSGTYKLPLNLSYKGKNIADTYPVEFVAIDTLPNASENESNSSSKTNLAISSLNDKIRQYLAKIRGLFR